MIDEFAVREVLGVVTERPYPTTVTAYEGDTVVVLRIGAHDANLTSSSARRLARQLHRIAQRIEERNA
jgi:hypothetical protein